MIDYEWCWKIYAEQMKDIWRVMVDMLQLEYESLARHEILHRKFGPAQPPRPWEFFYDHNGWHVEELKREPQP